MEAKSAGASTIVGSSGGNAGKAMAYASRKLNLKSVLFIPTSTPQMMIDKIKVSRDGLLLIYCCLLLIYLFFELLF